MEGAVHLSEKLERVAELWSPKIVARLNDYEIKVVRLQGDFVWHKHDETDELFLVLEGEMTIELRDGSVALGPGDLYVVARGVEHKPVAKEECRVLLVEPAGTVNTGDSPGALTAKTGEWV